MKELNEHGDGYEEYYYSEDREPVEYTDRDNIIHDDMKTLGYDCQYVNFRTGYAKFIMWKGVKRYKIEIDLTRGNCSKVEQPVYAGGSVGGGTMYPFTDDERYLIFKLMDKFDKENQDDEL